MLFDAWIVVLIFWMFEVINTWCFCKIFGKYCNCFWRTKIICLGTFLFFYYMVLLWKETTSYYIYSFYAFLYTLLYLSSTIHSKTLFILNQPFLYVMFFFFYKVLLLKETTSYHICSFYAFIYLLIYLHFLSLLSTIQSKDFILNQPFLYVYATHLQDYSCLCITVTSEAQYGSNYCSFITPSKESCKLLHKQNMSREERRRRRQGERRVRRMSSEGRWKVRRRKGRVAYNGRQKWDKVWRYERKEGHD